MLKAMYQSGSMPFPSELTVYVEQLLETPRSFFFCNALLYALSLTGAILMWNLRKGGFHLYTLAQLLVMIVTLLFLGRERLPLGDIMFTLLFVVYYYMALRNLGVFSRAGAMSTDDGSQDPQDGGSDDGDMKSTETDNVGNESEEQE